MFELLSSSISQTTTEFFDLGLEQLEVRQQVLVLRRLVGLKVVQSGQLEIIPTEVLLCREEELIVDDFGDIAYQTKQQTLVVVPAAFNVRHLVEEAGLCLAALRKFVHAFRVLLEERFDIGSDTFTVLFQIAG